jgi:hypothetical protein
VADRLAELEQVLSNIGSKPGSSIRRLPFDLQALPQQMGRPLDKTETQIVENMVLEMFAAKTKKYASGDAQPDESWMARSYPLHVLSRHASLVDEIAARKAKLR